MPPERFRAQLALAASSVAPQLVLVVQVTPPPAPAPAKPPVAMLAAAAAPPLPPAPPRRASPPGATPPQAGDDASSSAPLIACATLTLEDSTATDAAAAAAQSVTARMADVVVDASWRQRGVGRALVGAAAALAEARGCARIGLSCAAGRRAFYRQCGFEEEVAAAAGAGAAGAEGGGKEEEGHCLWCGGQNEGEVGGDLLLMCDNHAVGPERAACPKVFCEACVGHGLGSSWTRARLPPRASRAQGCDDGASRPRVPWPQEGDPPLCCSPFSGLGAAALARVRDASPWLCFCCDPTPLEPLRVSSGRGHVQISALTQADRAPARCCKGRHTRRTSRHEREIVFSNTSPENTCGGRRACHRGS